MDSQPPQQRPKRDFLFIDESGDPGNFSPYYILGVIHVTDLSLKDLNMHLGAMRYFGNIRRELKSNRLSKEQKIQLARILSSTSEYCFVRASAIYVEKKDYTGPYLRRSSNVEQNANHFRNLMLRRLLEVHFSKYEPQSPDIELVIDRFQMNSVMEQSIWNYLQQDEYKPLPSFAHMVQADSRYVELLQIADWISGMVKEKFFTERDRDFGDLFETIHVQKITK